MRPRPLLVCLLVLAVLGVGLLAVLVGPAMSLGEAFDALIGQGDAGARFIVREVRLPRVLVGLLVGACLAVSGALFQALLRNDLAEPYLIGVGPGALFGVTMAAIISADAVSPPLLRGGAAFLGALGVAALVFSYARRAPREVASRVVLAGVAIGAFVTSIATVLLHGAVADWWRVWRWLLGTLEGSRLADAGLLAVVLAVGLLVAWWRHRDLDLLALGEESAALGGVPIRRTLWLHGTIGCLLAAAAVAMAGLVGFVGLAVPHVVRHWVGPGHGRLLPLSALLGAVLLVVADTLARSLDAPQGLPLGTITAVLGAPVLAVLLLRRL